MMSRFANAVIGAQIHLFVFHRPPQTLDKYVVPPSAAAIHGCVFHTTNEVRDAVRGFAARYNAEWLIEKNGYLSPLDARAVWLDTCIRRAA